LPLCKELGLVHAVDPFLSQTVTPGFIYFRLHGGKGFKHIFTSEELLNITRLIPADTQSYVMFNNINMLEDAGKFQSQKLQIQ